MLAVSSRLGPYEIVAPLGAGGMGEVYRARDTRLGREVAVKVLPEPLTGNSDRLARFEREARAVAALSHPNILAIHDYGTHESVTYAVMELLEGETLGGRLARGRLPWREAIEVGAAIADGLAAAHAKGIVHRDLKPENLFVTTDGRVKILDFGLARMAPPPSGQSQTAHYDPVETQAGTVMGTVGYMSPEQVRGQPADATSDLFSFGCVLYEMVTGRRAFQRETAAETMTAILHDEPVDLTNSGEQVPLELGRIIRHCLAKTPGQRLQSAGELARALRATASDPALHRLATARRFTPRPRFAIVAALLIGACSASAYLLATRGNRPDDSKRAEQASAIKSVAILPFVNVGDDPKTEHLSEGIPDTVIHRLSALRVPDLKVQSLLSVARYKGRKPDLEEVRHQLGVGTVITGRVQQQGDRIVVSVALTDVRDGSEIWGDAYDGKLDAVLALQDKIARDITAHLRLRLTGEEERRLAKRDTDNPEAYQLYLKGRYFWNKRSREGLEKAIEYFGKAIDADPTYALAYAGLADAYAVFPDNTDTRPSDSFPKAKAAATKALEIDNQLAEPHATLALIITVGEWNWSEGESRFKRAIELDPNYATARKWYGQYLTAMGRFDEAQVQYQRAQELAPLSLMINVTAGYGEFYARRYDEAIGHYRKTLEMDPAFWVAHVLLGQACIEKKMYEEALAEFEAVRQFAPGHLHPLSLTGRAYALMGRQAEARKVIAELRSLERYVPPCRVAVVFASLGDNGQALDWLEMAYEGRCSLLRDINVEPAFKDLHSEPRYIALLQRMGLADKVAEKDRAIHSVAVLPFKNLGGDPQTEFLSNGLPNQIIDSLRQVRRSDLTIRSLISVSRYKAQEIDVPTIARELNVQVIVTGTLDQLGDDLSITVELVDARDDDSFWSHVYRGKLQGIQDLHDEIARAVAANLRLRLTGEEDRRLTKHYTTDPKAFLLYLEAMNHFNKFTPQGLMSAIRCCKEAIEKDPQYALAHAALARCDILRGALFEGPRKTFPDARKSVAEALKFDANLPEAHTALGAIHLFDDWDWQAAEHELITALDRDPNVILNRNIYGFCLAAQGRLSEALDTIRRGQELEPLAAPRRNELAMCYNWMRRYDEAIDEAKRAVDLDPNFFLAYGESGLAHSQKHMHEEAIQELQMAVERSRGHPRMRGLLGHAYAAAGQTEQAQAELKALLSEGKFGTAFAAARIHAALGENEEAIRWLKEALDERDSTVIWLRSDPTFDNLRSDARFAELLKEMGLPP